MKREPIRSKQGFACLVIILGLAGLLSLCGFIFRTGATEAQFSDGGIEPRLLLDEALKTAESLPHSIDSWLKAEISVRLSQIGESEKSKRLLEEALHEVFSEQSNWDVQRHPIIILPSLISEPAKRGGFCKELGRFVIDMATLVKRRAEHRLDRDDPSSSMASAIQLHRDIQLAVIYWEGDETATANLLLTRIASQILTIQLSDGWMYLQVALLLTRAERDAEAMKVLQAYEAVYDSTTEISEQSPTRHWMVRVANLAQVAEARARAGRVVEAKDTFRRALDKARNIPVNRLNAVFGSTGTSLQSAAFRSIAYMAALAGEAAIAKEAQWAIVDEDYRVQAVDAVIRALVKTGDLKGAEDLVSRQKCCWSGIALGMAEREDWASAIETDQSPRPYRNDRKFGGTMAANNNRSYYFQKLAEARLHAEGTSRALEWARAQADKDKISALLGIVDALLGNTHQREKGGSSNCLEKIKPAEWAPPFHPHESRVAVSAAGHRPGQPRHAVHV